MNDILKIEYDGDYRIVEMTIDGETYTLEGQCSKCGKCCTYSKYNVGYNDDIGCCSKLKYETIDGKPIYVCSIYENRPVGCLLWPSLPQQLQDIPECTYKLIKKVI